MLAQTGHVREAGLLMHHVDRGEQQQSPASIRQLKDQSLSAWFHGLGVSGTTSSMVR